VADNSIIARLASKSATADWDTYNQTTDSLEAATDRVVAMAASRTLQEVIDEVQFVGGQTTDILADTNELQTDWADGGRLDLLVDAILADTGTDGVVVAAGSKTGYALAATGLDSVLIESGISAGAGLTNDTGTQLTSINAKQALSLVVSAAAAGVLAGAATTTITIKPAGLSSGNTRITATVDSDGNRSALTLKVPD
jgi:hypothetical protein